MGQIGSSCFEFGLVHLWIVGGFKSESFPSVTFGLFEFVLVFMYVVICLMLLSIDYKRINKQL